MPFWEVEERFFLTQFVTMANGAAHDAALHITTAFVAGDHAIGDGERARADVVSDHLQAGAVVFERQIRELAQRENELVIRSGDLAVAQTNFDEIRQQFEQDKMLNLESIKILEGRNKLLETQIADLQAQVEKLHAVLIDETTNVKTTQAPMLRIAA